ncbi:MAG: tyrosine-type recombinase/integrase [Planctomycetes bacterium]|nr:tyrosine-type recombinase/integrase [Planctomycetota bacterium]
MGRRASVRYYKSREAYFTHFEGRQIPLVKGPDDGPTGPTYLAALDKFRELMAVSVADVADQGNTVRLIVDLYGQHLERNGQERSLKILLDTCTSAVEAFGDCHIGDLKPIHITDWLALKAKPRIDSKNRTVKWKPTYQGIALRTLVTALNWAKGQGLISRHCLENTKAVQIRGKKRSRGQEAYIPPATCKKLMDFVGASNQGFADLLRFLYETGCRPSEAYHVEARYYHRADKCVIYPGDPGPNDFVWKNARRTGKDRVIFLSDGLAEMVEERIARYPEGRIFRTKRKTKWVTEAMSVNLRWYAKKLKITPAPTAYGFRHTFATDWLLNAGSIKVLADLIGTSVTMIERHYGHLMVDKDRVRAIMTKVMKDRGSLPEELHA